MMKKLEFLDNKTTTQRDFNEDYDSKDYYREKFLRPKR